MAITAFAFERTVFSTVYLTVSKLSPGPPKISEWLNLIPSSRHQVDTENT
jgi:hypothetical protein